MRQATRQAEAVARPLEFFKGFLRNPREVGSIIPSSKFLTNRVLEVGRVAGSRVIVELGPGTGVLTREILRRMPSDGTLVAIEISASFSELLRRQNPDPRLHVHTGSSVELEQALEKAGVEYADLVLSGIPFSTMERGEGRATLEAARRVLGPDGRFVAYQFRGHVRRMAEPLFGRGKMTPGIWNLPPMRIYSFRKDPFAPA